MGNQAKEVTASEDWIGVDLDGTLTTWVDLTRWDEFGEPIEPMVSRVRAWLADGRRVKVFTARVGLGGPCQLTGEQFSVEDMASAIQDHLEAIGLPRLEVTCRKDYHMIELWDDRCVQVIPNTGT